MRAKGPGPEGCSAAPHSAWCWQALMSMPAPTPRRIAVVIAVVLVALAVAVVVYVHHLLQPQRFTALLENDLAAAGIRLDLDAPAEPALFPHPGVQLQGFSLTNIGSGTPVLQASGATIVVPWRALLHGDVDRKSVV